MLSVSTVGPKGQVVIPKSLRDEFRILPGEQVVFEDNEDGVLIKRVQEDSSAAFERISRLKSVKGLKHVHVADEEYEEKLRRILHK